MRGRALLLLFDTDNSPSGSALWGIWEVSIFICFHSFLLIVCGTCIRMIGRWSQWSCIMVIHLSKTNLGYLQTFKEKEQTKNEQKHIFLLVTKACDFLLTYMFSPHFRGPKTTRMQGIGTSSSKCWRGSQSGVQAVMVAVVAEVASHLGTALLMKEQEC